MTSPSIPAASAVTNSDASGSRRRPAAIPAAATPTAIAERAARSWCPRNDGCRQPAFQASNTSRPKNWSTATADATADQSTSAPSRIVRSCAPPNEQRHGDGEQGVLPELDQADEVVGEAVVVERDGPQGLERQPGEERRSGQPERTPRSKAAEPEPDRREDCGHDDDERGDVRQPDVHGRRPDPEGELGLEALVDEEERDGRREDDCTAALGVGQETTHTPAGGHRGDLERGFGTGGTIGVLRPAGAGATGPARAARPSLD